MVSLRAVRSLVLGVAVALAAGCGNQPARVLLPEGLSDSALRAEGARASRASRIDGSTSPILCFSSSTLDYCYPTGGYCVCPENEILNKVYANTSVTMSWSAEASPGRTIRKYRWSLDIEDVTDETPRINEDTDLQHWSMWSATAVPVTLGPWSEGEQHVLYVDVEDDMGYRSLGMVKFDSRGSRDIPPGGGPVALRP